MDENSRQLPDCHRSIVVDLVDAGLVDLHFGPAVALVVLALDSVDALVGLEGSVVVLVLYLNEVLVGLVVVVDPEPVYRDFAEFVDPVRGPVTVDPNLVVEFVDLADLLASVGPELILVVCPVANLVVLDFPSVPLVDSVHPYFVVEVVVVGPVVALLRLAVVVDPVTVWSTLVAEFVHLAVGFDPESAAVANHLVAVGGSVRHQK